MRSYTVMKGDSLWMIAKRFGVSLEEVIKANPGIRDPNKIRLGDEVEIPLPLDEGRSVYMVQSGDTMWSVAKKFSVALADLIAANPEIKNVDALTLGDILYIPEEVFSCPTSHWSYTVQKGDTLWKIAEKYGVDFDALLAVNGQLKDKDALTPGMNICVPAAVCGGDTGVNNGALYYVKNGDTLLRIAQRYAMEPEVLRLANPQLAVTEKLRSGMQLYLPGFHYVRSGETLYALAAFYQVPFEEMLRVNPALSNSDELAVGEKLAVPRQANGDMATYTVKQGDTLYKIAQKYNISVEAILNRNPDIRRPELIEACRQLRIPGPHLVQRGQTLAMLAAIYGVAAEKIKEINSPLGTGELTPQTMVLIPAAETGSCRQEEIETVDYVLKEGESFAAVAAMYRLPLSALQAANPDLEQASLLPGTVISVPTPSLEWSCYRAEKGDSLWEIAGKFDITVGELLRSNPRLNDDEDLTPGRVVRIPLKMPADGAELRAEEPSRTPVYPEIYVVRRGDTLFSVAKQFNTEVKQLRLANEMIRDSDRIYPGQQLIILPREMACEYRCLECPWLERGITE